MRRNPWRASSYINFIIAEMSDLSLQAYAGALYFPQHAIGAVRLEVFRGRSGKQSKRRKLTWKRLI